MEVAHQDWDLRTRHHQHEKHQKKDTEKIVDLVVPNAAHDAKDFREYGPIRYNAPQQYRRHKFQDKDLVWNLTWNLIRADGVIDALVFEPMIGTSKAQRHRHQKPHGDQNNHGAERDGGRTLSRDEEKVQHQK